MQNGTRRIVIATHLASLGPHNTLDLTGAFHATQSKGVLRLRADFPSAANQLVHCLSLPARVWVLIAAIRLRAIGNTDSVGHR